MYLWYCTVMAWPAGQDASDPPVKIHLCLAARDRAGRPDMRPARAHAHLRDRQNGEGMQPPEAAVPTQRHGAVSPTLPFVRADMGGQDEGSRPQAACKGS